MGKFLGHLLAAEDIVLALINQDTTVHHRYQSAIIWQTLWIFRKSHQPHYILVAVLFVSFTIEQINGIQVNLGYGPNHHVDRSEKGFTKNIKIYQNNIWTIPSVRSNIGYFGYVLLRTTPKLQG